MNLRELVWPILERPSDVEAGQDAATTQADLDFIRQATLADDLDTLLDETRRLTDAETDRRKTAESKATIYLTVVGVFAPILASITPTILADKGGLTRPLVTFAIFMIAGLYLLRSGLWAFRTLQVGAASRLDAVEHRYVGAARSQGGPGERPIGLRTTQSRRRERQGNVHKDGA